MAQASSDVDALKDFFLRFEEGLATEAAAKGQKFPLNKLRFEVDNKGGVLYGPSYIKYILSGRGPGKFPPPDAMLSFVNSNPEILERARQVWDSISAKSLAFLIGRKIAREGTDVWSGKKEAMDFLGVLEKNLPELRDQLVKGELGKITTALRQEIKK